MTVRASIATREAALSSDFGRTLAERYFPAEDLARMPRYVRGPKAGAMKGFIVWRKCESGGWVSNGRGYEGEAGPGYVQPRGMVSAALVLREYGSSEGTTVVERRAERGRTLSPAPLPLPDVSELDMAAFCDLVDRLDEGSPEERDLAKRILDANPSRMNFDRNGRYTGPIANENGWTA